VYIINTLAFHDERGAFARWFCNEELCNLVGSEKIVNVNFSRTSEKGTVRGMHFQYPPKSEIKFVRCIRGKVHDVIVDIRKDSPTYGEYFSIDLSSENMQMLMVPKGFAHGFQCLEDGSEIMYLVTEQYSQQHESGLNPLDPYIGIKWPLPVSKMSDKDRTHKLLDADSYTPMVEL